MKRLFPNSTKTIVIFSLFGSQKKEAVISHYMKLYYSVYHLICDGDDDAEGLVYIKPVKQHIVKK